MWEKRRVASWVIVGVTASLVELALLRGLYELAGWPLPFATALAAEILIVAKFVVSDRWVFGYPWPNLRRLARYHGASAGALVAYWLVVNGLGVVVGLPYAVAFIVGTSAAFTWSLATNFLWVWARTGAA
ncbi:MAG TPA: GtrA family protein [Chloroflexota bacterium]